jgi:hypothetical protein
VKTYYTYIKVYGSTGPPHLLPKYFPDKLLSWEFTYQTMEKGITTYLSKKNKKYWPIFPLHLGRYTLRNKLDAKKEAKDLKECICA